MEDRLCGFLFLYLFVLFALFFCVLGSVSISISSPAESGGSVVNIPYPNYYFGTIQIGTPPRTISTVIFDTGSADSWFYGHAYNFSKSSTAVNLNRQINSTFHFSTQSIPYSGNLVQDFIIIGGLKVMQSFVADVALNWYAPYGMSGALGFGFKSKTILDLPPFLESLFWQTNLAEEVFALEVTDRLTGSVLIGGANSSQYIEPVTWVPVNSEFSWQFKLDDVLFNSNSFEFCPFNDCNASFSLGTPPFGASPANYSVIVKLFGGNINDGCFSKQPNFTFVIEDVDFTIPQNIFAWAHFVDNLTECDIAIIPGSPPNNAAWDIGNLFSWAYYTIFDVKSKMIGFAQKSP